MINLKITSKKIYIAFLVIFFIFAGGGAIFGRFFGLSTSGASYWNAHGFFLLLFLATVPRLTLLFSSIAFGGLFWWIGLFFAPRFLIAILATINYWHSNEFLVFFSWLLAFEGESKEKNFIRKKTNHFVHRENSQPVHDDIFEAEYREKN